MNEADKERVRQVYREAFEAMPDVDTVIAGWFIGEQPATKRLLLENSLKDEAFYVETEQMMGQQGKTLDQFIDMVRETYRQEREVKARRAPGPQPG